MHVALLQRLGAAMAVVMVPVVGIANERPVPSAGPPVTIRLYDQGELSAAERAASQTVATEILANAQVPLAWIDCSVSPGDGAAATACAAALSPQELIVRVTRAADSTGSGALGSSLIDADRRRGWLATIFVNRVDRMAGATGIDRSLLVGRAMAHEVAHLLAGTTSHSPQGLMRAVWWPAELRRARPADWLLSTDDRQRVRAAYQARHIREPLVVRRSAVDSQPGLLPGPADPASP